MIKVDECARDAVLTRRRRLPESVSNDIENRHARHEARLMARGKKSAAEAELRAQALAHSADALAALAKVAAEGGSDAARVSAANAILDRAHGKARPLEAEAKKTKSVSVRRIERVVIDPANPDAKGLHAPAWEGPVQGRVRRTR